MSEFQTQVLPARPTAVVRGRVAVQDLPAFMGRAFSAVAAALQAQGLAPGGEPFACYHGMPDPTVGVEAGFPIAGRFEAKDGVTPSELPGGLVAIATHVGPYQTIERTYNALNEWVAGQKLAPADVMWETYLTDPQAEPNQERWETRIFLPVVPRG